ncbi:MAG: DUF4920 domain-containing protein [Acidobacteria bacterium]|jgi:hypothetical protein|nr:DUF4920 domain-containing protein [Acidobacteriota bacterium]
MKKILSLTFLTLVFAGISSAQDSQKTEAKKPAKGEHGHMSKITERKPFEYDNASVADAKGVLKRGAGIGSAKKVSLAKAMKQPSKYEGNLVMVEGVIVRSCKTEGCWMELAPADNAKSVRVKFKNHAFFIPLDATGMKAKVEGMISVKTLTKAEVDHLIDEDGAKFETRNADGTVTEISFEATGVELTKK